MKNTQILVVEDHEILREVTVDFLVHHGYLVTGVYDGVGLDEICCDKKIDLLILDLNLPGENGFDICQRIRAAYPRMGIIILSARTSTADKVRAYELGADFFMVKPTSNEELLGAVRSLLRRVSLTPMFMGWVLDPSLAQVSGPNGSINLSDAEARIIKGLAFAPDRKLEYWQLLELVNLPNDAFGKAAMEVRIVRLRKKLNSIATGENINSIRAIHRVGYVLNIPIQLQ